MFGNFILSSILFFSPSGRILLIVGQGPIALAVGGGCLDILFSRLSFLFSFSPSGRRGWSGGAMVLGRLPVPGRPTILITVGQGPTALAVDAGGGCLDIFTLIYPFSLLSPSLWETTRYRLKYCLKGLLSPKTTNQPLGDGPIYPEILSQKAVKPKTTNNQA